MDLEQINEKIGELEDYLEGINQENNNPVDEDIIDGIKEYIVDLRQLLDIEDNTIIKNLDNFIWKLKLENLYTPGIETFIKDYMRYYND